MRKHKKLLLGAAAVSMTAVCATTQENAIVHDAEYYINRYAFDVSGGMRYNSLEQNVRIKGPAGTQKLGGSESWFEPVIGFRGATNLSKDWSVLGIADASGFGVEDNDLAWIASLVIDRQLKEKASLKFGYRYYNIILCLVLPLLTEISRSSLKPNERHTWLTTSFLTRRPIL